MAKKLVVANNKSPVSLDEAKSHLRYTDTDEDKHILGLIRSATEQAELFTGRSFMPQTWEYYQDRFTPCIELPRSPVIFVTSVQYIDTAGILQTIDISDYFVDDVSEPARIVPDNGWNVSADNRPNAVKITFVAGYADKCSVPDSIKHAIMIMVADMFEHRESFVVGTISSTLPLTAENLLWPYKVIQ
jgi:uncharacterized phiE125 gp8 family phage protein